MHLQTASCRYIVGIGPHNTASLAVYIFHDHDSFFLLLVENRDQNRHNKIFRGKIIIQQHDTEQFWFTKILIYRRFTVYLRLFRHYYKIPQNTRGNNIKMT